MGSGANAHIILDSSNLTHQQTFHVSESVTIGNGSSLQVLNTGSTIFNSGQSTFHLNKILHCPQAATNLISINQFCLDNNCYFILTATDFIMKENLTSRILLHSVVENSLYPLAGYKTSHKNLTCLSTTIRVRANVDIWHSSYPSKVIFDNVFRLNKLSVKGTSNKLDFCLACQLGKAKQLPFLVSSCQSFVPLALIHSNVWVSHVQSTGGCSYYVLFIDDYSRYSWLYLLHRRSNVFETFVKFKTISKKFF